MPKPKIYAPLDEQKDVTDENVEVMNQTELDLPSYHYWRECINCGHAGGGYLHCLHDGIQGECHNCFEKLPQVEGDCACEFVTTEQDLLSYLHERDEKVARAAIADVIFDLYEVRVSTMHKYQSKYDKIEDAREYSWLTSIIAILSDKYHLNQEDIKKVSRERQQKDFINTLIER